MKTLTIQADRARARREATVIRLATLTLWRDRFGASPASTILYLSDDVRVELGQTWLPLVKDWGSIGDTMGEVDPSGTPGGGELILSNTLAVGGKPRFSDLIRQGVNVTGTYEGAFADLRIEWLFSGGLSGDQVVCGTYLVDDVVSATEETVTLRFVGRERLLDILEETGLVNAAIVPPWMLGKAYAREIRFDFPASNAWEIDAAYVAGFGTAPPILRDIETLEWSDLGHAGGTSPGFNDEYQGYMYLYARDPSAPFSGATLKWFLNAGYHLRNCSSKSNEPPPPLAEVKFFGLTGAIEIFEFAPPADLATFNAYTSSNPPTFWRTLALVTPPSTVDTTAASITCINSTATYSLSVQNIPCIGFRMQQWLTEFGEHTAAAHDQSNLLITYNLEIS